ncbi:MAG: hypothetical protein NTY48_05610, partial [Candidatus Diapherotrites archaeon]|nr:hypothetical protein [Candidatus Diapherotrites archaeon]
GDGYIDKKRVECKEPDIGIISYFKKCVSRSFYLNTQIIDMQTYKKIRVYSSDLCRFFKNNFPESALLSGKLTVPKKIMMAKNEIVAQYIRGLFDADGGAHARFVYLNRIDEHLLKTVQILLLRFGILSNLRDAKVKSRPEWKSKKQYRLDITDFESLNLFAKKIGFTKKGKKHKTLKRILGKQSKKKRNSKLVSPFTYKEMKEFMAKNDIPRESLNYRLIQQRTESKRMNYETLNKYCLVPLLKNASKINSKARKKLRQINYLLGGGYLTFCEIKEKSISKNKELLIDISVPKTKNFVANGLIVHNSIAAGAKIPSEKLNEFLELLDKKIEEQLNNSKKL